MKISRMHCFRKLADRLKEKNVEMRGDKASQDACSDIIPASDEDWGKEYLDYILSIKTVKSTAGGDCSYQPLQHRTLRGYHYRELHKCRKIPGRSRCRGSLRQCIHPFCIQMDLSWIWCRRSASVPRNFMPEDRWD